MSRLLLAFTTGMVVCGIAGLPQTVQAAPAKTGTKTGVKPGEKPVPTAAIASAGAGPTLIGQFGAWGAYTASSHGRKVCFALAKPSSSKVHPPSRQRDPAYAFVSTRPSEKVFNEVSIMIGYTLKPGSASTLEVGGGSYPMYIQGDSLWIKNAAEEQRMVDAMRHSGNLVVKGVSAKGMETIDTFSLGGLAQALDRIAKECRR